VCSRLVAQGVRCSQGLVTVNEEVSSEPGDFERYLRDLAAGFESHLTAFAREAASAEDLVVDLTPGTKLMTRALEALAPADSWLVSLQHDFRPARRADPKGEWLGRMRAGERAARRLLSDSFPS